MVGVGLEDKKSEAAATEEDRNPDSKNPAIPGSTSGHTGGTLSARRVPHSHDRVVVPHLLVRPGTGQSVVTIAAHWGLQVH